MTFIPLNLNTSHTVHINLKKKKLLCIKNDEEFRRCYKELGGRKLSLLLLEAYAKTHGKPLNITLSSLHMELLGHLLADEIILRMYELRFFSPIRPLLHAVKKRTQIIDCGEGSLDGNRWFWDLLAFLPKR